MERSQPKEFIRGNTKIGPVLEVDVTNHLERNGLEIKIDCIQKDGTESWMVTSNGVDTNVTELSEENKKLIYLEEASSSTTKLVDETELSTFTVFLFVNVLSDQSMEMERHAHCSEG